MIPLKLRYLLQISRHCAVPSFACFWLIGLVPAQGPEPTDQSHLGEIALKDKSAAVRKAAAEKLTDQNLLLRLALEDRYIDTREIAVRGLTDQTLLARVALEATYGDVRKAAIDGLTDQALLVKVVLEDKACDSMAKAHSKYASTNQLLCETYRADWQSLSVRGAAVKKLTDQNLLARLALEDRDSDVRKVATKKLTDQAILEKVAIEDTDGDVRKTAVDKLTDQTLLANVAIEEADAGVRGEAFGKVTDQRLLARIAVEGKDPNVRLEAVTGAGRGGYKLTDQAVLAKVSAEDKTYTVRMSALLFRVTDQALLANLAVEDKDADVRIGALRNLHDQSLLARIATEDKNAFVRTAAAAKLTDPSLRISLQAKISAEDPLRAAVVSYLLDAAKVGWAFSAADTTIVSETVGEGEAKATVVAQVVFKGGTGLGFQLPSGAKAMFGTTIGPASPLTMYGFAVYPNRNDGSTCLMLSQTLFLVKENGVWKVSELSIPWPTASALNPL